MDLFKAFSKEPSRSNETEIIEKLCNRLASATMIEDKKGAVLSLKSLSRDYQLEVGTMGMNPLITLLQEEMLENDIVIAILDTIMNLVTDQGNSNGLGLQFTEIFVKDKQNIDILVSVLNRDDFYVKYGVLQLFNTLSSNVQLQMQDTIITCPNALTLLVELLSDSQEILRNEAVLFLIKLSECHADIQKIIVFQNSFDLIFSIVSQEGGLDGGIIVEDCLNLIFNLIQYNISNQKFFRENNCFSSLDKLLQSVNIENHLDEGKMRNIQKLLNILNELVSDDNPATLNAKNAINRTEILQNLSRITFSSVISTALMSQGHEMNQKKVEKIVVSESSVPQPIIVAIINKCLSSSIEPDIRRSFSHLFQCLLENNPDTQLAIVSTMVPPPSNNPNDSISPTSSAGFLIVSSLFVSEKSVWKNWFASILFASLLKDNLECKKICSSFTYPSSEDEDSSDLVTAFIVTLMKESRDKSRTGAAVAWVCLICFWIEKSPEILSIFLNEGSFVQFLIEQINMSGQSTILLQGCCAFLFALICVTNNNSQSSFSKEQLIDIISSRIGMDIFMGKINRLKNYRQPTKTNPFFLDLMFVKLIEIYAEPIQSLLLKANSTKSSPSSPIKALPPSDTPESLKTEILNLKLELETIHKNFQQLSSEHESLLLCLADTELSRRKLKKILREKYNEPVSDDESFMKEPTPEKEKIVSSGFKEAKKAVKDFTSSIAGDVLKISSMSPSALDKKVASAHKPFGDVVSV